MFNLLRRTAGANLLILALVLASGGCAMLGQASKSPPPVSVPETTWWQVESDIGAASLAAKGLARDYAHGALSGWRDRVRLRTDTDFVPWFTSYWTQQWLAVKVSWYKANTGEDRDAALMKLSAYLEEKYRSRVLGPVAKEVDPNLIRRQATAVYVQSLGERVRAIPLRYGIPRELFDQRLKAVVAIAPSSSTARSASLHQLVYVVSLARLPAYEALMERMSKDAGPAGTGAGDGKVSPMAKWTGDRLEDRFAASGGASAAAAILGGLPGMMISLVATGIGVAANESEKPEMEARLRKDLYAAIDDLWFFVLEDPAIGVLAGVYSISGQIEEGLARTRALPVKLPP